MVVVVVVALIGVRKEKRPVFVGAEEVVLAKVYPAP